MNTKYYRCFPVFLLFSILFIQTAYAEKPLTWAEVKLAVRKDFPGISFISTQQLFKQISNPDTLHPVLIDARAPGEFAISHIRGARNAEKKKAALEILDKAPKDTFIVVYCSVGYRSAALVKELIAQGYTNVHNLEGSVFEWANGGRPVYNNNNEQVQSVHPYDKKWGALLKKELWFPVKKK